VKWKREGRKRTGNGREKRDEMGVKGREEGREGKGKLTSPSLQWYFDH